MPEKIIATCSIRRIEVLDESGDVDERLMPQLGPAELLRFHELMVLSRAFDRTALSLQREGRLGTYAPILGQEASQIGTACCLRPSDWVFPSFREMGVYITLGFPMRMLFQYWSGDERGMKTPGGLNIFPVCVPVGTQVLHATGAAMALKLKKQQEIAVCYFGDGGTSKGDFHEGFNMAGVYGLPVVYVCQNNQWAISVPRSRQSASESLAQKAFAYGFEGIQVDGNDVFAVYSSMQQAVEKARLGGGPTFIECFTYRIADHTTADDASRYRDPAEVEEWKARDPLLRLQRFLRKQGLLDEAAERETEKRAAAQVAEAVAAAEAIPPPDPADIFRFSGSGQSRRQARQAGGI
ncbi:MAG: pyruvate dehydrogenase (acetyl-transferring) E1 component subunit alpha [Thermodesulfovibrionales bacterium]